MDAKSQAVRPADKKYEGWPPELDGHAAIIAKMHPDILPSPRRPLPGGHALQREVPDIGTMTEGIDCLCDGDCPHKPKKSNEGDEK